VKKFFVCALIIGFFRIAGAEESTMENSAVNLERIVITNKRSAFDLGDAAENITVISAGQIKELPARDLSEVLSYIPGVNIETRQGFGRATSISIQGCDSRQVRVMVDGVPLNSQSSGQVNPVEFPIENLERIEVIKGSASSLWGSALGGVVNLVTKDTGKTTMPKFSITNSFAEFNTRKNSFDLSGKAAQIGYYIFSSYMESAGKDSRSDVLEKKTFAKFSYDLKGAGRVVTSFGYSGADVNNGILPDGSWEAQPYIMRYGKLGWEKNFGINSVKIDLKHSRQNIATKSFNTADDTDPASRTETKDLLYQLSLNSAFHPRKKDLLVLGADFDQDALKSSVYLSTAKSLKLYAPYANYNLNSGPWDTSFGLRYDKNSEFGKALSPSLGVVYHFTNFGGALVRAGVARAFNAPPLLWKFNESAVFAANPDIKAERAWVYNLGVESNPLYRLWGKFSLYRSDISDALATTLNESGKYYKKNFQKFRRQGVELEFRVNLCAGFDFFGSGAFNDAQDRSTRKIVRGSGIARQSFSSRLEYANNFGFKAAIIGYYNRWNQPASAEPNDRKMLFDLKASQAWKNLTFFLNLYNLSDSKYWADNYFPLPERYFEGGFSLSW